jgi:hypothetical protein
MLSDFEPDDFLIDDPEEVEDPAVEELEPKLIAFFEDNPEEVFYETQLSVLFEKNYFHWVTVRALRHLRDERRIGTSLEPFSGNTTIRFYFHRRNRYWKRRSVEIKKLVGEFSDPRFTQAIGLQGEAMVDAALPRIGFLPRASNVKTWNDKAWTTTNHDLDRVFTRDGIDYGCEIKNRLGYIPQDEFRTKLLMCRALGLRPLFVARMMPKVYVQDINKAGGFAWIMGYQFYPFASNDLANRVRATLRLPVDCPARLQDGTLQRFLKWHEALITRFRAS